MDAKIKNSIAIIKQELAKLKGAEEKSIQAFYEQATTLVKDLTSKPAEGEEDKKEEPKKESEEKPKEEKKEEKSETIEKKEEAEEKVDGKEEKVDEKPEEVKSEEVKEAEKKVEDKKESELSRDVSAKLKEAALELDRQSELLTVKDVKIAELSAELKKYKDAEQLELEKAYDIKVGSLVELYASLNIKKDSLELKENFNEEQIDKLIIDLSAMQPTKVISKPVVRRQTTVSADLELNRSNNTSKEKGMTEAQRANEIFNLFE